MKLDHGSHAARYWEISLFTAIMVAAVVAIVAVLALIGSSWFRGRNRN